jgi:hypothetical protein
MFRLNESRNYVLRARLKEDCTTASAKSSVNQILESIKQEAQRPQFAQLSYWTKIKDFPDEYEFDPVL